MCNTENFVPSVVPGLSSSSSGSSSTSKTPLKQESHSSSSSSSSSSSLTVSEIQTRERKDGNCSVRLPGRLLDKPPVSVVANKAGGRVLLLRAISSDGGVGVGNGSESLLESHESDFAEHHATVAAAYETAGESERITGLLEVRQPVSCIFQVCGLCGCACWRRRWLSQWKRRSC